jgi:predicted GNAT family N-acyltransferase
MIRLNAKTMPYNKHPRPLGNSYDLLENKSLLVFDDPSPVHPFTQSELTAAGFYEGLGYCSVGKPYDEDGVPCITLEKQLSPTTAWQQLRPA